MTRMSKRKMSKRHKSESKSIAIKPWSFQINEAKIWVIEIDTIESWGFQIITHDWKSWLLWFDNYFGALEQSHLNKNRKVCKILQPGKNFDDFYFSQLKRLKLNINWKKLNNIKNIQQKIKNKRTGRPKKNIIKKSHKQRKTKQSRN